MLLILQAYVLILTVNERLLVEIKAQEEKFATAFRSAPYAMLLTRLADGHILEVNDGFVDMSGYSRAEVIGQTTADLRLWARKEERAVVANELSKSQKVREAEFQFRTKSGAMLTGLYSAEIITLDNQPWVLSSINDITKRKQAEDELRANRQQLADIIEFLPDATLAVDRDKRVIIWNKAIEEMTGVSAAAMIGRGDYAYTIPFYGEARPQLMDLVFEDQAELAARYPTIAREGDTLMAEAFCNALYNNTGAWVTAKASPLHDQAGNIIGAIESIRDITARKRGESQREAALEALRESKQQLNHITDNIPVMVTYVSAQDYRFKFVNRTYANAFGMQPQDLIGKQLKDILLPSTYERSLPYYERVCAGERVHYENKTVVPVSGESRWLAIDSIPELDEQGIVQNILSLAYDITERQQAEEALRESEEKYRRLVDNANEAILVTQDGWLKFVNRMTIDLSGYSEQEFLSAPFSEFIHPADRSLVMERHLRRLQGDVSESKYEFRLITRDGGIKWAEIGTVLIEWAGRPAALSFLSDISARKQAEAALRESEQRYRVLFESSMDAIMTIEPPSWKFTSGNPATLRMFGAKNEEDFASKEPWAWSPERQPDGRLSIDKAKEMIETGMRDGSNFFEWTHQRANGEEFPATVLLSRIEQGENVFIQATVRDITAPKRAEAQLRESNAELQIRNEELDVFAHMVAHDLKNPLGAMMGYAELLTEAYTALSTEVILETLGSITRLGRKTANIIESLFVLASVRKQDVRAAPLDMARIVAEVLLRLTGSIQDSGADIRVPDRASWPVALGHALWIEEIWINYLSNAIKYGGPQPRIDLDAARLPPPSVTGEGLGGGFIRFSVRDYGPGLTPEQQERLFAPFERLGQVQAEGHGLGLSIVRHIADKLGGQVGVDSQPGQGSAFYFTLPAAPGG